MNFEESKENIQPLATGRNASLLQASLSVDSPNELLAQRRRMEAAITNYEGDDPLEPWYTYISWIEQAFPSGGKESGLEEVLSKCLSRFEGEERYYQDRRMIKLFIKFIESHKDPAECYNQLFNAGIGTMVADFYISWAYCYDVAGNARKADEIFRRGIACRAQPLEDLKEAHQHFGFSVAQRVIYDEGEKAIEDSNRQLRERRLALSSLRGLRHWAEVGTTRTGIAVKDVTPGVLKTDVQIKKVGAPAHNVQVAVFNDENRDDNKPQIPLVAVTAATDDGASGGANVVETGETVIRSIVDKAREQENLIEPGPWNNPQDKKKASKLFPKETRHVEPSFPIHLDEEAQRAAEASAAAKKKAAEIFRNSSKTSLTIDKFEAIKDFENTLEKPFKYPEGFVDRNKPQPYNPAPVTIETEPEPNTIPEYNKCMLYPRPNMEFQHEELRAYNWLIRRCITTKFTKEHDEFWRSRDINVKLRQYPNFATKSKLPTGETMSEYFEPPQNEGLVIQFAEVYNSNEKEEYQLEEIMARRLQERKKLYETIMEPRDMEETVCIPSERIQRRKSFFPVRRSMAPTEVGRRETMLQVENVGVLNRERNRDTMKQGRPDAIKEDEEEDIKKSVVKTVGENEMGNDVKSDQNTISSEDAKNYCSPSGVAIHAPPPGGGNRTPSTVSISVPSIVVSSRECSSDTSNVAALSVSKLHASSLASARRIVSSAVSSSGVSIVAHSSDASVAPSSGSANYGPSSGKSNHDLQFSVLNDVPVAGATASGFSPGTPCISIGTIPKTKSVPVSMNIDDVSRQLAESGSTGAAVVEEVPQKAALVFDIYRDPTATDIKLPAHAAPAAAFNTELPLQTDLDKENDPANEFIFKTPALPIVPVGAAAANSDRVPFEIFTEIDDPGEERKSPLPAGGGLFEPDETCSTQIFNNFLQSHAVSTPKMIQKVVPRHVEAQPESPQEPEAKKVASPQLQTRSTSLSPLSPAIDNIASKTEQLAVAQQSQQRKPLTILSPDEPSPTLSFSPPGRKQLSTILETSEYATSQGTHTTDGTGTTKSTISSPETELELQTLPRVTISHAPNLETVQEQSRETSTISNKAEERENTVQQVDKADIEAVPVPVPPTPAQSRLIPNVENAAAIATFEIFEDFTEAPTKPVGNFSRLMEHDTLDTLWKQQAGAPYFQDDRTDTISKFILQSKPQLPQDKGFQDDKTETIPKIIGPLSARFEEDKTETIPRLCFAIPSEIKAAASTKAATASTKDTLDDYGFDFFSKTPPKSKALGTENLSKFFESGSPVYSKSKRHCAQDSPDPSQLMLASKGAIKKQSNKSHKVAVFEDELMASPFSAPSQNAPAKNKSILPEFSFHFKPSNNRAAIFEDELMASPSQNLPARNKNTFPELSFDLKSSGNESMQTLRTTFNKDASHHPSVAAAAVKDTANNSFMPELSFVGSSQPIESADICNKLKSLNVTKGTRIIKPTADDPIFIPETQEPVVTSAMTTDTFTAPATRQVTAGSRFNDSLMRDLSFVPATQSQSHDTSARGKPGTGDISTAKRDVTSNLGTNYSFMHDDFSFVGETQRATLCGPQQPSFMQDLSISIDSQPKESAKWLKSNTSTTTSKENPPSFLKASFMRDFSTVREPPTDNGNMSFQSKHQTMYGNNRTLKFLKDPIMEKSNLQTSMNVSESLLMPARKSSLKFLNETTTIAPAATAAAPAMPTSTFKPTAEDQTFKRPQIFKDKLDIKEHINEMQMGEKSFELNAATEMFNSNNSMIKNSTCLPPPPPAAALLTPAKIIVSAQPHQSEIKEMSIHIKDEPNISLEQSSINLQTANGHTLTQYISAKQRTSHIPKLCFLGERIASSSGQVVNAPPKQLQKSSTNEFKMSLPNKPMPTNETAAKEDVEKVSEAEAEVDDDSFGELSIYDEKTPKTPKQQVHVWQETEPSLEYVHPQIDLNETHQIIDELCMDPNVNPFCSKLIAAFLDQIEFTAYVDNLPNCQLVGRARCITPGAVIRVNSEEFKVAKLVGEGAYGAVYCGVHTKSGKKYALKQERPPNYWEYYICLEIHSRLNAEELGPAFMHIDYALMAHNSSILISEFSPYGSLIAVCNKIKKSTMKNVDEYVVMHLTCELLDIMDHLHAISIIHADIKADNFLLMNKLSYPSQGRALQLIDFGVAIDMKLFKPGQTFNYSHENKTFKCVEMHQGRPWTYQLDLYGLAGVIHCMLFGKYMEVAQRMNGIWMHKTSVPRYFNRTLWETVFSTLLNVRDCGSMPNLQYLRALLKEELAGKEKYVINKISEFNRAVLP